MHEIEEILKSNGVSPTPVRKLVYRCIRDSASAISLSDIETILETVDKSTISRTLALFKEQHLIHSINDGSGSAKYETCISEGSLHDDVHVHFRCLKCGETICMKSIAIPQVELPKDFKAMETSYIISGICSSCNHS